MYLKRKHRPRVRVIYDRHHWHAVALDPQGKELARSPGGNEQDAELYMANYRSYGAWLKS